MLRRRKIVATPPHESSMKKPQPRKAVRNKTKYIFIAGGVVSSLGKGVAAAAIGRLLSARGLNITFLKFDPYLNIDPGTMNPYQHGEVFVTDDGAETDLDLGHYERFTSVPMSRANNCTAGRIYHSVVTRERRGDYLGGTVQVVPHVTDEIKQAILALRHPTAKRLDVAIIELGGTVGDIESLPFLEAIRQFPFDVGRENVLYILLTLVPYIKAAGELKTKPTQHSVNKMREIGIQPDILLCRTEQTLDGALKAKIALFCSVESKAVINACDVENIFEIPLRFHQEGLDDLIVTRLELRTRPPRLAGWTQMLHRLQHPKKRVRIQFVGKYVEMQDAYKSLKEALTHGGGAQRVEVQIDWINSERLEQIDVAGALKEGDGILVAGGFGNRGIEGKIAACRFARENGVPFLGICLGMQCAVIEFARHRAGLTAANSTEFDAATPHPVIHLLPGQDDETEKGGTMRLGGYPCRIERDTRAYQIYGADEVRERHRHRYEFNNDYRRRLSKAGMAFSGCSPDGRLVEMIEIVDHPWFVAVQFHPEFLSRPDQPHPLLRAFIAAATARAAS